MAYAKETERSFAGRNRALIDRRRKGAANGAAKWFHGVTGVCRAPHTARAHERFPDRPVISPSRFPDSFILQDLAAFLDMIEIVVDRSDSTGEVFLANDTTPNYIDTTPFPATPTKWTYRAIYRVGDSRVGQWSKPVSVTGGRIAEVR